MRWPWQHREREVDPETRALIDAFNDGIDSIRQVSGELRKTASDLRVQMGEEDIGRSRGARPSGH